MRGDLAARRVSCPSCPGRLAPWAYARARVVSMMLGGRRVRLTARRARCTSCRGTQVLPAGLVRTPATPRGRGHRHRTGCVAPRSGAPGDRRGAQRPSGHRAGLVAACQRPGCAAALYRDPSALRARPDGGGTRTHRISPGRRPGCAHGGGGRGPATPRPGYARAGVGADRGSSGYCGTYNPPATDDQHRWYRAGPRQGTTDTMTTVPTRGSHGHDERRTGDTMHISATV
jgi:hypothetical protein